METVPKDGEDKKELDDSGCVQDVGPPLKAPDGGDQKEAKEAHLLDLSDDVLLYILKYCSPMDLKALGYTCPRLGRLICDRTLWQHVDATEEPTGRARLRWLLAHALGSNTTELLLTGYAREARGCLGHVDRKRNEIEEEIAMMNKNGEDQDSQAPTASTSDSPQADSPNSRVDTPVQVIRVDPLSRLQRLYAQQLPRYSGILTWPEDDPTEVDPEDVVLLDGSCSGPQFTLTQCMLRQLCTQCSLTSLALQYCNINCNTTGINHFPRTLKKLSLRGSKCYNLPLDKSFLFNIQDYLPQLEYLDLSECEWLEPASFLPLSKVNKLTHLVMRDCHRMTEFVAYASLATRYGFRSLKHLDARGSPLGDSEVAALGWLPSLEELWLAPARAPPPRPPDHSHCRDERLPPHADLLPWEADEPEYFKIKPQVVEPVEIRANTSIDDIEEHIEHLRNYENNICLHGLEYNLCMEGIRRGSRNRSAQSKPVPDKNIPIPPKSTSSSKQKMPYTERPGPSSESETQYSTQIIANDETQSSTPASTIFKFKSCSPPSTSLKSETPNTSEPCTSNKNETSCQPSSSKDTNEQGTSLKRPTSDEEDIPSKKTKVKDDQLGFTIKNDDSKNTKASEDSSDDDVPLKKLCKGNVNEGASTSQNQSKTTPKSQNSNSYIRFRRNMDPVIVRRDMDEVEEENREREMRERDMQERPNAENQNREARPRAHVLYVNVGQQLHTVYRLAIHNEPPIFYSFSRNSHLRFRPNIANVFYTNPTPRLDAPFLITDAAVRRFGRAHTEDVIYFGPSRLHGDPSARPNRSNLRLLSITGFRNITDRSLEHLAIAAPHLRSIDFSESGVTAQGVENFKSLRPDCEVVFSEYVERDDAAS